MDVRVKYSATWVEQDALIRLPDSMMTAASASPRLVTNYLAELLPIAVAAFYIARVAR